MRHYARLMLRLSLLAVGPLLMAGVDVPGQDADLALRLAASPDPVAISNDVTIAITVQNLGPGGANGVVLTNPLPANAAFVSASSSQGACTNAAGVVVCELGTIANGASATVSLVFQAGAAGFVTNRASVSASEIDPDPANNSAQASVQVLRPALAIGDIVVIEGDAGTNVVMFAVSLWPPTRANVSVNYATLNGTAVSSGSGADYTFVSGTLQFPPGTTNRTIAVGIRGDTSYETNETFSLNLTVPVNAGISDAQGVGTINNDDPLPSVSVADLTIAEGNSGTTQAVFRVRLSSSSSFPVVVTYATANGTASAGSDYVTRSGSLTFVSGSMTLTQTVTVLVVGDLAGEGDETFSLNILSITNALLADGQGIATIVDNEIAGALSEFTWNTLPSPHYAGQPLSVTVTARDGFGDLLNSFTGSVSLAALSYGASSNFTMLGSPTHTDDDPAPNTTEGYSFTPSTPVLVTHVRHYAGNKVSLWSENGILLTSQMIFGMPGNWNETRLARPVQLSANTRYRIGYHTDGSAYGRRNMGTNFAHGRIDLAYSAAGDIFPTGTNSLRWPFVDIRYITGQPATLTVAPTNSDAFSGGTWSGSITVHDAAEFVVLRADDNQGHRGFGNPIDVRRSNDVVLTAVANPNPTVIGEQLTYTFSVHNTGPDAATGVVLTNLLSPVLQYASATTTHGTVDHSARLVTATIGTLGANSTAVVSVFVSPTTNASVVSLAGVSRGEADADLSNNSVTLATATSLPIVNGSFETGDFTGWITNDLGGEVFQRLAVRSAGYDPGFGFFRVAPAHGQFAAVHGFGGFGPGGRIRIAQDIFVPARTPSLLFDYRMGWGSFGGTNTRIFAVNIEPAGGGTALLTTNLVVVPQGSENSDTGPIEGELDLSMYAGGSVRVAFDALIPQGFSGIGFFQLDNVRLSRGAAVPPTITSGPDDLSLSSGKIATFHVDATGTQPISYRWFFNDTNALNVTGPTLVITNITLFNAGLYHVIVSNAFGSVTSRTASLSVDDDLVFRILALRTNGFTVIEHENLTGDDRGAIAVSSNQVFYTGDSSTVRWDRETLSGPVDIGRTADALVTDLRTETLYSLADGNIEILFGGTITSLLELSAIGEWTGRRIDLSRPIPAFANFRQVGIFAGYGRVVIHDGTNAFNIALPSGQVTDLGPTPLLFNNGTESWAYWGIAEYFNNSVHLVYVDSQFFPRRNISRMSLPSGTLTTMARFTNLADMAAITFSTSLSRWFFHHEGQSQFYPNFGEVLGSAKALFTTDPGFPAVVRNPISQTNYPGGNVVFSVIARGTPPLSYQWYFNGNAIDGATGDTFSLNNITTQEAGDYTVEVSNGAGSVLSSPARLSVFTVPIVRSGPFNRTVYPGQTTTFSVVVDGAPPLSYEWRFNGTPIPEPVGTNRILVLTNIQPNQAGLYSVRVTNIFGTTTSSNATLTVITAPFIITQPSAQANYLGSNVTFSVTADGAPPLAYQWRFNGTPVSGATNATLVLTGIEPAHAGIYTVEITNRYGAVTSVDASLTVLDPEEEGIFQITALLTNGCKIVEHEELTGDDRGGIAVSRTHAFVNGDTRTGRFLADDLTGGVRVGTLPIDSMVTDLRTETVYLLGNGTNVIRGGTMTTLIEMDANGAPTNRRISLSAPVPLGSFDVGIFAGYGRVVIHNGTRAFSILVPSGIVQDLGPMASFSNQGTETWAYWGVAEHVRSTIYLVYVDQDQQTIARRRVPDGMVSPVATFNALSDMASIVVSPSRRRWYFHYEGFAQFGGNFETLGYCNATFNIRSGSGLDHFAWGPIDPLQTVNTPFPITLTALNASNNVVTNFSGTVALSGLNVSGGTPVNITPTLISNFVSGVWTGQVTVAQASPAMFVRADDRVSITADSPVFSVNLANDLVVLANDSPDPVVLGETLTYSILVTNIGPNPASAVVATNTLATNLVFMSATSTAGACINSGNIVRCDLGTIAGASGVTITVQTTPSAIGNSVSQISATRGEADPTPANNSVILQTLVRYPAITIADISVAEGDSGTNDVAMTLTLAPSSTNTVTVNFATANGTAVSTGSTADYVARSGIVTFAPGETNQTLIVRVRGDRNYEVDETFNVNLSAPTNAVVSDSQGVCTIVNDDPVPSASVSDVAVTEGNSGTNSAIFRVSLSGGIGVPVVVTYSTADGSATAGSDYNSRSGSLTFTAGTLLLTQSVTVQVLGDVQAEPDERFFLNLTSVSNAVLAKAQGLGTIRNDDGLGVLHHFDWASISSPQQPDAPIPVSISARDISGNAVTNFNGSVSLRALPPSTNILGNVSHTGAHPGIAEWSFGYAFVPTNDLRVTHVQHYFGTKVSIWTDDGLLLASVPIVSTPGSWSLTPLTNDLVLRAGSVYRLGIYTTNWFFWREDGATNFADGFLLASYQAGGDTMPGNPDAIRWWFVDLVYTTDTITAPVVMPSTTGLFSEGVWSGTVSISQNATNLQLEARDSSNHSGRSNPFDVLPATDADIGVKITATNFVHTGSNVVVMLVVTNRGPGSATGILLTNALPSDFDFISAIPSQGSCSNAGSTIVCDLGTLSPRSGAVIPVTLRVGSVGTKAVFAFVDGLQTDPFLWNNSARFNLTIYLDTDADGIWDEWEIANGTRPNDPSDAGLDPDGDGHTNLQEFQAGTNPNDATSVKLFTRLSIFDGAVRLGFRGAIGNTYRVERSDDLATWTLVSQFRLDTVKDVELVDAASRTTRFYRAYLLP